VNSNKRRPTQIRNASQPRIDPRSAFVPLRIGRSGIHAIGVFAEADIPRGAKIIEYTGERLTAAEAADRYRHNWKPQKPFYLLKVSPNCIIDAEFRGSGAERINHSCDANVLKRIIRRRAFFFAKKSIAAGTELTLDYNLHPTMPHYKCACGSANCRGTFTRRPRKRAK
jgi:SET domain-containing protein